MKKILIASILIGSIFISGCSTKKITNNNVVNNEITLEQAKEIALKNANLTESEVIFISSKLEIDDGIKKYDIEFYHENKEYDYEINAVDGSIIEMDFDVENYNISQEQNKIENNNSNLNSNEVSISEEKAKEIVLNNANLTIDQVTFKKVEMDFDNGIKKYDIEFYYNNKEYSYEIDASTGSILEYDID